MLPPPQQFEEPFYEAAFVEDIQIVNITSDGYISADSCDPGVDQLWFMMKFNGLTYPAGSHMGQRKVDSDRIQWIVTDGEVWYPIKRETTDMAHAGEPRVMDSRSSIFICRRILVEDSIRLLIKQIEDQN